MKRGLIGLLATLLALAGISVVGWLVFGLDYVEARIMDTLAEQGFPARTLTLRAVGIGGAELADLDLDYAGGVTVETIEAEYRLSELIGTGRIDRLTVSGLRLDLTSLPAPREEAESGTGGDDEPSSFSVPVEEIAVRGGRIAIGGPLGTIDIALDLDARSPAEGGMAVSGEMRLRGESGEIETPFAAAIAPDGAVELTATPEAGRLEWRGAALDLSAGSLAAAGSLAGPDRIDAVLDARISLPDGSIASLDAAVDLEDDVLTFRAATVGEGDGNGLELTAAVQGLSGSMTGFDAELAGDVRPLNRIAALAGIAAGRFEDGRLTIRLSGRAGRSQGAVPQTADGRILVLGQGALASGERGAIDMAAQFALADGAVRLTGERPLTFGWRPPDDPDSFAAALGEAGGKAFEMSVGQAGTGWTMALAGPFALNHGLDGASGEIDLTTSLDWSGRDELVGPVQAEFALSGLLDDIGTLVEGRVELAGDLAIRRNRWRFRPHGCVRLGARRLSIQPTDTRIEGFAGCLEASSDEPMLAVSPGGRGGLWVSARLRAEPATVLLGADSPRPTRLNVELPLVRFDLGAGADDEISVSGAGLTLRDPGLAFEDIAFIVDAPPDGAPGIRLDGVTVRSLQSPEWFAPVSVIGDASLTGEGGLVFQGSVRGGAGAVAAAVSGNHDTVSGQGRLEVKLDPVSFAPGIRQPADLAPLLAAMPITDVTGSVDGVARLGWGDRLTTSGELGLEDLTLSLGGAVIRSIDGRLRADSLLPLSLPDGQLLALGGAEFGLRLEEGALAFGLDDGDRLSVQGLGFGLAGGSLAVEPFQARLADQEITLAVTLQGVDLDRLSRQFPAEGLSITGRIDGRIPLRLTGDTITVDNGVVESTEAGVIRYVATVPVGPPEEGGVALLITAVENFRYEALRATLDGRTGEDLDVAIRLTGANPELYDGFPIALNVNLSGALDQILLSGLRSLTIADEAGRVIRGE